MPPSSVSIKGKVTPPGYSRQLGPGDIGRYVPGLSATDCEKLTRMYSVFAVQKSTSYSWKHDQLGAAKDCRDLVIITGTDFTSPAHGWFLPRPEYATLSVRDTEGAFIRAEYKHVKGLLKRMDALRDRLAYVPPSSLPALAVVSLGFPLRAASP